MCSLRLKDLSFNFYSNYQSILENTLMKLYFIDKNDIFFSVENIKKKFAIVYFIQSVAKIVDSGYPLYMHRRSKI